MQHFAMSNTIGPVTGSSGLFGNAQASGSGVNSSSNLFGNAQTSAVGSSGGGVFGGASMAGTAGTLGANPTLYQCPPNEDPILWQQAQSDNPDLSTLVPVVANGFDDLRKRVDSQSLQMQSYQERSSEVTEKLSSILQKHHSETVVRLSECRRRQADLSQRLLEFMKLLQLLRLRGQLLNPEEEVFRVRVEHLEKEMSRSGSLKQRLAELQDHTYRLQAASRRRRELLGRSGGGSAVDGYEVADEAQLESVMKVLSEKQRGLARMTQIMSLGAQSIEKIEGAIEERYVELQKQKEAKERAQISKSLARPW
ncbi:Nucleoporin nup57 [Coemansia sp. RSA 1939]|nr:Nucleoporin nup57 [Coemansia sp. RSA 1939]